MELSKLKKAIAPLSKKSTWDKLDYLYRRWGDEKEYEDFKDYEMVMRRLVQSPIKFIKATKRPFGFTVLVIGREVRFFATAKKLGWETIS